MLPVLVEQGLKIGEQLLRGLRRQAMAAKTTDNFLLTNDMPLALGNMIVNHCEVGSRVGHGRP